MPPHPKQNQLGTKSLKTKPAAASSAVARTRRTFAHGHSGRPADASSAPEQEADWIAVSTIWTTSGRYRVPRVERHGVVSMALPMHGETDAGHDRSKARRAFRVPPEAPQILSDRPHDAAVSRLQDASGIGSGPMTDAGLSCIATALLGSTVGSAAAALPDGSYTEPSVSQTKIDTAMASIFLAIQIAESSASPSVGLYSRFVCSIPWPNCRNRNPPLENLHDDRTSREQAQRFCRVLRYNGTVYLAGLTARRSFRRHPRRKRSKYSPRSMPVWPRPAVTRPSF